MTKLFDRVACLFLRYVLVLAFLLRKFLDIQLNYINKAMMSWRVRLNKT